MQFIWCCTINCLKRERDVEAATSDGWSAVEGAAWGQLQAQWVCVCDRHLLQLLPLSLSKLLLLLLLSLLATFISRPATFVAIFYGLCSRCVALSKHFLHFERRCPRQAGPILSSPHRGGEREIERWVRVCFSPILMIFPASFLKLAASSIL